MKTVSIIELLDGLREIPTCEFVPGAVCDFLRSNPVAIDSLEPYIFFNRPCYTRNLIFKNDLFEAMTLCWESGQATPIHDHDNQFCWMAIPRGQLRVVNYRIAEHDAARNLCRVEPTEELDFAASQVAEVDPSEPIHLIVNQPELNTRAVSLHIYSRPFESCHVYSTALNEIKTRHLCYYSVHGRICTSKTRA